MKIQASSHPDELEMCAVGSFTKQSSALLHQVVDACRGDIDHLPELLHRQDAALLPASIAEKGVDDYFTVSFGQVVCNTLGSLPNKLGTVVVEVGRFVC